MRESGDGGAFRQTPSFERRALLSAGLALSGVGLAGCSLLDKKYRYRLFLEVEVDGQRYLGWGVREAATQKLMAWPDQGVLTTLVTRGEAFWIDIPGKPTLFVILQGYDGVEFHEWGPDGHLTRMTSKPSERGFGRTVETIAVQEAHLPADKLPALVYFRDIAQSGSGDFLNPLDLASIYGAGARIVSATVSRTREPLTRGIKKKLPWFESELKKYRQKSSEIRSPRKYRFSVTQFYSCRW